MCSRSVFPIFLVIQWSPHPGPGFPTFAGIFEFAIRYFALERCFPFLAGTLFILLSLEVPRYQDTPSAQVLTGIIRSPLSKNLQRVLLRRDPFRHQPLPHLVFCFHIMLISSEFLRFERKCGRGWSVGRTFNHLPYTRDDSTCKRASDWSCLRYHCERKQQPDGPGDRTRDLRI